MLSLVKKITNRFGVDLQRIDTRARPNVVETKTHTIHRYVRQDGSFDYERYKQLQSNANKQNLEKVWAREGNIEFLANYIRRTIGQPKFGICHGTRRGAEQEWFRRHLNCDVIGTEISETATQFPHTIQWDFHDVKPAWVNSVDFIYSNSFDHSYDPEKALNAWMSCLRPGGLCFLEHSSLHSQEGTMEVDPFGAEIVVMPYLILTWSKGKYGVRELLEAPERPTTYTVRYQYFITLQRY